MHLNWLRNIQRIIVFSYFTHKSSLFKKEFDFLVKTHKILKHIFSVLKIHNILFLFCSFLLISMTVILLLLHYPIKAVSRGREHLQEADDHLLRLLFPSNDCVLPGVLLCAQVGQVKVLAGVATSKVASGN